MGSHDVFLRKYDSDGNVLWTRQFGTHNNDQSQAVSVHGSGVYVAGSTNGTFQGQQGVGSHDAFVRKYDADGNVVWTSQFGTQNQDRAVGISVKSTGIYVAGWTGGTLPGQVSAGFQDAFVAKLGVTDGTVVWSRQFGTSSTDRASSVSVYSSGVYVAGHTEGSFLPQTSSGLKDAYVSKYDFNGNEIWTRQFGTPSSDEALGVSVYSSGVYVSGRTEGSFAGKTSSGGVDAFVRKYDVTGNEVWTRQFGTPAGDGAFGVSVDSTGAYAAGLSDGTLPGQTGAGGKDAFVVQVEIAPLRLSVDETVVGAGAASVAIKDIPVELIPTMSVLLAVAPLRSIDLDATPLRSIPLRSIDIAGTPLRSIALSSIPLRSIGGWEAILAGTPLENLPLQTVTLGDVVGLDPPPPGLASITLGDADLQSTGIGSISLASIALGSIPLRSIPLRSIGGDSQTDWCELLDSLGFDCAALGVDVNSTTLLALDIAGVPLRSIPLRSIPLRSIDLSAAPLRSIPLRSIDIDSTPLRSIPLRSILLEPLAAPLRSIPLRSIPLRSIDIDASPLRSIPLRSILLESSPLRSIPLRSIPLRSIDIDSAPLRSIPLRSIDVDVVCTDAAACANLETIGDAVDADLLSPDATLADIIDAAEAGSLTLGDLTEYGDATLTDIIGALGSFVLGDLNSYGDGTLSATGIGATPLRSIPLRSIDIDDTPLRSIPLRSIVLESAPLRSIPLRSIPLRSIDVDASPLRSIPLRSILLESAPLRSIPLRSIPLRSIDIDSAPLRSIPLRSIDVNIVCTDPAACSNLETIGDAVDADILSPNATLADIIDAAEAEGLTLGDLAEYGTATLEDLAALLGGFGLGDLNFYGDTSLVDIGIGSAPLRSIPLRSIEIDSTPLRSIPLRSIVLGSTPLRSIPLRSIPLRSIGDVAASPLRSIPLRSILLESAPLRSIPLRSIPLRSIDIGASPLRSIPLRSISTGAIDCSVLDCDTLTLGDAAEAGAILDGATVEDILDDSLDGFLLGDLGEYGNVTLGDIDGLLDGFVLGDLDFYGDVTLAGIGIGATPLRSIPLRSIDLESTPLRSIPLRSIAIDSVPLRSIPLRSIPLRSIDVNSSPLRSIPLRSILLESAPLRSIPLRSIPLRSIDIDSAPLRSIPLRSIDVDIVCTDPAACATLETIGDAVDADVLSPNATLADIISAAEAEGLTLGDLAEYGTATLEDILGLLDGFVLGDLKFYDDVTLVDAGISGAPLRSIPLRSIDIASTPLRSIPLRSIDVNSIPLRSIPLRSIALESAPLRSIPLRSIPLRSIDLNPSPLRSIPLRSIVIDSAPLRSIPLRSIPLRSIDIGASPLRSIPLRSILLQPEVESAPLRSIPLRSIPLRSIDLEASPLRSIPLRSIPLRSILFNCDSVDCENGTLGDAADAGAILAAATLYDILVALDGFVLGDLGEYGEATLGSIVTLLEGFILGDVAVYGDATLGDILGALEGFLLGDLNFYGDVTLGDITEYGDTTMADILDNHSEGPLGNLTLMDILIGLLLKSDYPWEELPLDEMKVQSFGGTGQVLHYHLEWANTSSAPAVGPVITVELPDGFLYVPGTSLLTQFPAEPVMLRDPEVRRSKLTWSLDVEIPSGARVRLDFQVNPGLQLGTFSASAKVSSSGISESVADQASVTVSEHFEPNDDPSTAPITEPDVLYLSHISSRTDVDFFRIPVPPANSRVSVLLSHLSNDDDLVMYRPGTAPQTGVDVRSVPLRSIPIEDQGLDLDNSDGSLQSETIQGIQLAALPIKSISASRSAADEGIDTLSRGESGFYTIQVSGFNGAFADKPYVMRIKVTPPPEAPPCSPRTFPLFGGEGIPGSIPAISSDVNTFFIVNQQQLGNSYGAAAAGDVKTALDALAARADVSGAVIPVEGDPDVAAAYAAWNQDPCQPTKANAVSEAITALIDSLRNVDANSDGVPDIDLKYGVIVGSDEIVPHARIPDLTKISNESDYAAELEFAGNSALFGSLLTGHVLSDDAYGDFDPVAWLGRKLFVPDAAVGRLLETPSEIIAAIDQFIRFNGLLDPTTALTTGYDFLADGAAQVDSNLDAILGEANATSIISETWTAGDLITSLDVLDPPDIISINAHYDHYRSLPADQNASGEEGDLFTTQDIVNLGPERLARAILFTMGCHSGLSVSDVLIGAPSADEAKRLLDWAQVYSQQGAVYTGNTGFGYGDTETVALSERLMALFSERLDGTMTVGQALMFAKQEYFGGLGLYSVYDEKVLVEATFYGLPMYKIGEGTPPTPPPPLPRTVDPVTGLESATVSFADTPTNPQFELVVGDNGSYYQIDGKTQVVHYRPIQPRTEFDVTQPDTTAHGALITALVTREERNFDVAFARPVIDLEANEPAPTFGDVAFPAVFQNIGTFNSPQGTRERLVLLPGQFFRDKDGTGIQRLFTSVDSLVYYSNSDDFIPPRPLLIGANVKETDSTVTFLVEATDETSTAPGTVVRVLVLFRGATATGNWTSLDLVQRAGTNFWDGESLIVGTEVEYLVQVVDSAGNVTLTTSKGTYFDGKPPQVDAGADQEVGEGERVSLDPATFAGFGILDTQTATIDWGDGSQAERGSVTQSAGGGRVHGFHVYADDGIFTVEVCVTGGGELHICDTLTVTVLNVPPDVNAGPDQAVAEVDAGVNQITTEDTTVSLEPATFVDQGVLDTHIATVDWGDGNGVGHLRNHSDRHRRRHGRGHRHHHGDGEQRGADHHRRRLRHRRERCGDGVRRHNRPRLPGHLHRGHRLG